jgi:transcriptional regulator NrdR family protein
MECPDCQHLESKVRETKKAGKIVYRIRECLQCGRIWTTKELYDDFSIDLEPQIPIST